METVSTTNWHTAKQAQVKVRSDVELAGSQKDLLEVIEIQEKSFRDGCLSLHGQKKLGQYWDELSYVGAEIKRREGK